ncbi:unnamed protein product [Phytophthora fragariaefolia]|uniref:Unnamed protein product n=1 Tax=Phytophthora fragariaefolia TaxID=1490495 RepID=A0A9W6YKM9_9STRA|nr:unnamed protein product [Phytophthora fragariaefolia]
MSTNGKNEVQSALQQLVSDLKSKPTLRCCDNYPGVSVEVLNEYLAEHGPLMNPVFGKLFAFWINEDYFIPGRDVVPGCCELAPAIATQVSNWAKWSGNKGTIMTSRGAYLYDERTSIPTSVRMPDVTYIPRHSRRNIKSSQLRTHWGSYAPVFVVEIDRLSGDDSQLEALDHKMRTEFFLHGVQLGWLIDPRPEYRKMYEYKCDDAGMVYCVNDDSWRDLDGGTVLPGFHLSKTALELTLDPTFFYSDDVEIDVVCPVTSTFSR